MSDDATPTAEVEVQGHVYRMTASPGAEGWVASVTGYTRKGSAAPTPFPGWAAEGERLIDRSLNIPPMEETGPTAAAALDALTLRVRSAAEEAVRAGRGGPR